VIDDFSNSNMDMNNKTAFSLYSADERSSTARGVPAPVPPADAAKITNGIARLQKLLMEKQQEQDQQAALLNLMEDKQLA
jgi:hypothetical protein